MAPDELSEQPRAPSNETDSAALARAAALLAQIPPFCDLPPVDRAKLAAALEEVHYDAGEVVFAEGAVADALYILREGSLERRASGVRLNQIEPAEVFGELGLLRDQVRSATIVALSPSVVWRLPASRFLRVLRATPGTAVRFAASISSRLARMQTEAAHLTRQLDDATIRLQLLEGYLEAGRVEEGRAELNSWRKREREGAAPPRVLDVFPPPEAEPGPGPATAPAMPRGRWRWRASRTAVGLLLAALILVVGWLLPPPPGLSTDGWHALVTLLAVVPLLALEALPEGIVALALAGAWVVGGIAAPEVALGGFASRSWVLVVAVLAAGSAIAASGVLYRLALWTISHAPGGGSFGGQAVALALVGTFISPAVPNATSRVTLVAPATVELAEALGYGPRSRAAAGLALAVLVGFGFMVGAFLTSSTTGLLVYAVLPESSRIGLDWGTWAVRALPTHLVLLAGLLGVILWRFRPRPDESPSLPAHRRQQVLSFQRALLGRPGRQEKLAVGVAVGMLLGFVTQPLHGIDPAWVGVAALAVLATYGALSADGLRAVNWSFALLFGILTSMANVFAGVGLDRWLAGIAIDTLGALATQPLPFVLVLALLCYAISFVLRWQAAAPLLTIALSPLALNAGIDPFVVGMVALLACNAFFLPYQSTIYLALYHGTNGQLFTHRQARPLAFAYAGFTLVALAASIPYWSWLGLLPR